ncbi:MAG: phosphatase [Clostridioides sp.]|jgi:putative hydrolase|nr:phosphatase [Clostridioides sp.]
MNLIADLHCHTISSGHAYSTVKENIDIARERNLKYLGISDHAPKMPGGPDLFYFRNMNVFPENVGDIRLLKGIEANIIDFEGNIDVPDEVAQKLDYVIASLHRPCIEPGDIEQNTSAVLNVMKNKYVRIIGHPDDSKFPLNYEKVVKSAKEEGLLLEVNNSSLAPDSSRTGAKENLTEMLNLCKKYRTHIIIDTDSHICYTVGDFEYALALLEEVDFPEELIVNCNEAMMEKLIDIKKIPRRL